MPRYLFAFQYPSPEPRSGESSHKAASVNAVWVDAKSKTAAIEAGREFARRWVQRLFDEAGVDKFAGWSTDDFEHGIETSPLSRFSGVALDMFEEIRG